MQPPRKPGIRPIRTALAGYSSHISLAFAFADAFEAGMVGAGDEVAVAVAEGIAGVV